MDLDDLVTNGGFESGYTGTTFTSAVPTDWDGSTCGASCIRIIYSGNSAYGGLTAPAGSYYSGLKHHSGVNQQATMSQNISLSNPNGDYQLAFQTAYRPSKACTSLGVTIVDVSSGGALIDETVTVTGAFVAHTIDFTNQGYTEVTLTFKNECVLNTDTAIFMDSVQLSQVLT